MDPYALLSPGRWRATGALCLLVSSFLAPLGVSMPAFAGVTVEEGAIEVPTYPWDPPVRHPYFRATDAKNIYPYPMLDNLSREKRPRTWRTVVIENEYLRLTFLPELGGKVYEVIDKTTSKPMFYTNHVVKPGLIGQCGAWVSGGIEFNTGPAGHTVSAVMPVDVEILPPAADGSRSVAVGEVERIYRTRWTVIVTLRPGRSFIEETVRIYNRTETVRPYYFWNCTAVPSTDGFRFIYPMTLGTDHSGTTFYTWPVSGGKDLSLARSYQDASSIFAYRCDQDFFGSYDEDADRGVVATANHHILPGKKAWTWGRGSYGTMHQMDLTDDDGPYNEVQTGPLPTQADVGRLDPHEAITWTEWWYPVHGIGGFTFANRDVAVNVVRPEGRLRLRMVGTGTWDDVEVRVGTKGGAAYAQKVRICPETPAELTLRLEKADADRPDQPLWIELVAAGRTLAGFRVPLDLPVREPPERPQDRRPETGSDKQPESRAASELVQAGWQEYLFARFPKAAELFREALVKDPNSTGARCGLAYCSLDRDPREAADEARAAVQTDPDHGVARYALAAAELRAGDEKAALEDAFASSTDPATAAPGRALAAKILIRAGKWEGAVSALSDPGPWEADPVARNRLALSLWKLGETEKANRLAQGNLEVDPLDAFARSVLWLTGRESEPLSLARLILRKADGVLELAAEYADLAQDEIALGVLERFYLKVAEPGELCPIVPYWAAYLCERLGRERDAADYLAQARSLPAEGVFPHRLETVPVLRWALEKSSSDGKVALYLGHLLFFLGRQEEGRECWRRAAELGQSRAVACRALGVAQLKLDGDAQGAARLLGEAHRSDPADPIVAMDLARVLFSFVEKAGDEPRKKEMLGEILGTLSAARDAGKARSDFVALLARAQNRLGRFEDTARLLDSVRITIWEGAREAHDLFEEAHVALGKAHLDEGRPEAALKELERALQYPENLATGRLEGTREAHIHYLRGRALEALGRNAAAQEAWKKAAEEPASGDAKKEEARKLAREALERAGRKE